MDPQNGTQTTLLRICLRDFHIFTNLPGFQVIQVIQATPLLCEVDGAATQNGQHRQMIPETVPTLGGSAERSRDKAVEPITAEHSETVVPTVK